MTKLAVSLGLVGVLALCGALLLNGRRAQATAANASAQAKRVEPMRAIAPPASGARQRDKVLRDPFDLAPAQAMLSWKGRPLPDQPHGPLEASTLMIAAQGIGKIASGSMKTRDQMILHILETLATSLRYPFAITLLDASAKATEAGSDKRKADQLKLAAIVDTDGDPTPFLRIIKRVINEQTDRGVASLQRKAFAPQAGGETWTYSELRDERLPEWSVIGWGAIGDYFVITVGEDVWPTIAKTAAGELPSQSEASWVRQSRRRAPNEPLVEITVAAQQIMERLDPHVQARATGFFDAWNAEALEQAHWALGFREQAMYCIASFEDGGRTRVRVFADARVPRAELEPVVPPIARYAVFNLPLQRFLPRMVSAFYATRSAEDRRLAAEVWERVQREHNVDAQADALAHLGDRVILHNHPPHPLNLPLSFTSLIEIEREPERVYRTLDTLCRAWQKAIQAHADKTGELPPLQLERDDDGIWHVQFLFALKVAWTFTDKYIITCWSPQALRDYLDKLGPAAGKRFGAE